MKDESILLKWEELVNDNNYKEYFISYEDAWYNTLDKVKIYIDKHNCRPSGTSKNIDIKKMGSWICNQQTKYKKKSYIMKDEAIRLKWEEFISDIKYKEYMMSYEEVWYDTLDKLKVYIDENKRRPSSTSKNIDIKKSGAWICNQLTNYKRTRAIMKDEAIRLKWEDFISDDKYKEYFVSYEDAWYDKLNKVKVYMDQYNCRPSSRSENKDIKTLNKWVSHQVTNYKNKSKIMKDEAFRLKWEEFVSDDKYKEYFTKPSKKPVNVKQQLPRDKQFRIDIVKRDKVCIISGEGKKSCEAAHIIPFVDSDESNKYNIDNGILLSASIHKLFDKYLWSINELSEIVISNELLDDNHGYLIRKFGGKKLNLNDNQMKNMNSHYHIFKEKYE